MSTEDRSRSLADAAKGAAYPVRRLLDPRFADMARRLQSVIDAVRAEADVTRSEVEAHVGGLNASTLELVTHVGERLDGMDAAIARLEVRLATIDARLEPAPHEARTLSRDAVATGYAARWLQGAARVLCVPGDGALAATLTALGHEVSADRSGCHDAAVVLEGNPPMEDLHAALAPGATLVLALPAGLEESGSVEPAALDRLLDGWDVEERMELARTGPATWEAGAPVVGQGVVLVRARRVTR